MSSPAVAEAQGTDAGRDPRGLRAPAYRPDIDGLRAIAVIAVVLFHAGIPGVAGGYAGVDVFFVISGYLITQLLEESHAEPARRRLASFYLRRARRILPALFAVCVATAIAAVVLFLPDELQSLGKYLAATALLLSNVASWTDGGYFAYLADDAPLNHLWSIAVEEQFYLLYPLVLLAITRYLPRTRRATLVALGLASLALCVWASYYKPGANYFLAPTRAWELLLGAALALGAAPRLARRMGETLALASLLCLVLVMHLYTPQTRYPGTATLLPCLATATLIATGGGSRPALVNRLLAWRPLVFVGLISYSIYLWHQPLLVFVAYYHITPLAPAAIALELAVLVLLAIVSWRFIERPTRSRVLFRTPHALLAAAGVGSLAILLTGLVLWRSDGLPQRFSPATRALLPEWPGGPELIRCLGLSLQEIKSGRLCRVGPQDATRPKVLVWGDSHALALMPAYTALAAAHHMSLYFVGRSSCLPLLVSANPARSPAASDRCTTFNAAVAEAIARLDPRIVILGGHWIESEIPAGVADIPTGVEETARAVGSGTRSVCAVMGVPQLKYRAPYALVMARRRGIGADFLRLSRADARAQYRGMERSVLAFAQRGPLKVADPKDALCPGELCLYQRNGRPLYFDDNHLSAEGARFVAPTLEPCFAGQRPGDAAGQSALPPATH